MKLVDNLGIVLFISGFVVLGIGILGYIDTHDIKLLILSIVICCMWSGGTFYDTYISKR